MHKLSRKHAWKYIENFTSKNWKVLDKTADIFHTSAQNMDFCGYSLEPPNEYPQSFFRKKKIRKNNAL